MTALSKARQAAFEVWNQKQFTLAAGNVAWKNGLCGIDLSTGKVEPAHGESDLLIIGTFAESIDATLADKLVNVQFDRDLRVRWFANSTTAAVVATDVGSNCYAEDDQTVGMGAAGASIAGRVWAVSAVSGVAVELLAAGGADSAQGAVATAPAFAAGNLVVPAGPSSGSIYDVPFTAANSFVTLPAAAEPGTILRFVADGVKNGHTVQYRDATGPVNLTAALVALKRHQVTAIYLNGIWTASADVAP